MADATIRLGEEADLVLGAWRVSPSANELFSPGGDRESLEPRVMQVLVALARRPGQAVSRERLLAECWGDTAVTDDALTRCVSRLRRAFARPPGGVAIETVSKIGYRLVLAPRPEPVAVLAASRRGRGLLATSAVVLIALAVAVLTRADRSEPRSVPVLPIPVTALSGTEQWPALSPSGGQVAFAWRPGPMADSDLWVQSLGNPARLRLTTSEGDDYYPAWSPDGGRLAFARRDAAGCGVHVVSAVGGPDEHVGECRAGGVLSLDWSPRGEEIVFTDREGPLAPGRATILHVRTRDRRPVLDPGDPDVGIEDVAFSPDGEALAFTAVLTLGVEDLHVHRFADGTTRRITRDGVKIHGFDWLPDGSGFVVSSNRGGPFALWHVPLRGEPALLPGAAEGADEPRASATRIVYEAWRTDADLVRLDLARGDAQPLLTTTRYEWDASRSPDGSRLAFVSDRSGAAEVWVSQADGSGERAVTRFGGAYTHTPRWSPDGSRIALAAPMNANLDLYEADVASGRLRRLTNHAAQDFAPAWTGDGRGLFFGSTRSGSWQIWRLELSSGVASPVTTTGGRVAQPSPDGRWLYYSKADRSGLWRMGLEGEDVGEDPVLDDLAPVDWNNWQVVEGAVYYVRRADPNRPELVRHELASRDTVVVREIPDLLYKSGLWVSPDEREAFVTRVKESEADLMLIEVGDW